MDKALSAGDCLKQAEEYLQSAEATSDPKLRDQYLEVAGHLTCLAGLLDRMLVDEISREDSEKMMEPEREPS